MSLCESEDQWRIRCEDAEATIRAVNNVFLFIPINAFERGYNWIPSEETIQLLRKAKDRVRKYSDDYWQERDEV